MTTLALRTDLAGLLRATGLLRSFMANDDLHVNAVMEAVREDPDALMRTFGALVGIATTAITSLALANVYGDDVDQTLYTIQRQLMRGDVPPPAPAAAATTATTLLPAMGPDHNPQGVGEGSPSPPRGVRDSVSSSEHPCETASKHLDLGGHHEHETRTNAEQSGL